ncbi:endonuclease/exonuclease/phosphatase family domain-containing protein 1-like [Zootermopsis nevadensis]|uniref:Endonuclease/exonuclease/phosphatase family domain-containing protein 1 n=1 Tax=Zootermopsis nevadensis TaxID=136037 RepID=A0A067R0L0_ZOONE|nr:endonuclease/exonuclease/phosphatase family domain-containing protein 1-like [Zootermopsis nevadensis]XP_021935340.1 endonuclease/exonuclease/phosphatase family domain-containing protein 1-like [Zootermopsis nevadensis]XP_021935342.1 endonuclease/exonuclease/phosphatase family domain-containing protein 1-like [Zootermopsis nevadensis]KDR10992.1 Endonuclease/exonuclease/phosphatase family domain-containing protein 1 [Zootermopsis nevadensis]
MRMGQNSSVPTGVRRGRRKSFRESWRSPFPRRSQTHQGSLSATFNFIDVDLKVDQLNVNTASEEELMTLPGITRNIAQNIVEYRQAIGRFKKVEDLALVSGIGAVKLDLIRPEICVSRRKNVSCASSRAQSLDSLPSTESNNYGRIYLKGSPHSQSRTVNINTANVFELMVVPGFNQELAANVVDYRERKGLFLKVEDLIKVKGMNQWRLGTLRPYLMVDFPPDGAPTGSLSNGTVISTASQNLAQSVMNGKLSGARKTPSFPLKSMSANGFLPGKDIFELLSAYSQRPILEDDFLGERNGKAALRIATWNLHDFTLEKVENPGVKEIVCRTILENSFSVIAVQEIVDAASLKQICDELNFPTLRRVIDWKDNERAWKFALPQNCNAEYKGSLGLGFLYDSSYQVELTAMKELCVTGPVDSITPKVEAVLATFQVEDLRISLLNMYIQKSDIYSLENILQGHVKQTDMLIILGDFTGLSQNKGENEISRLQYKSVIPMSSNSHSCSSAAQEYHYSDNIFLNSETQLQFTGVSGMVRQGLNHLAIPRGWMWGGPASEHCPVWCELYTEPVLAEKVLPNGTHYSE